jgi:antitoxin (DNA-binding transcriptional repressor) of toxin-antitoxin stability system
MKTATVRDLRNNFAKVSRWLKAGEQVQLTSRGVPMGVITPEKKNGSRPSRKAMKEKFRKRFGPEHTAWLKETYGGKKLSGNSVLIMREGSKW